MPSFSLGQEFEDVADHEATIPSKKEGEVAPFAKPMSTIYNRPQRERYSKVGEKFCSPYINRQMDIYRPNTRVEIIISNLIFAMEGSKM